MPLKFDFCPHCQKKIIFKLEEEDIDARIFPAPVYVLHRDASCNKLTTFYVDSLLRISFKEIGRKRGGIKTIETVD